MYKAGASFSDKNAIAKHHRDGKSVDQIVAITLVTKPHVIAIIKQIKAGTMRFTGKLQYKRGDDAGNPLNAPTESEVKALEAEQKRLADENQALREQLAAAQSTAAPPPGDDPANVDETATAATTKKAASK